MNPSLKELGRKLDDLHKGGAVLVNEGDVSAVLSGLSATNAAQVVTLVSQAGLAWSGEDAADGAVYSLEALDSVLEPFRLTVDKPRLENAAVLFTLEGLRQWLERDAPVRAWKHVQSETPFSTLARRFLAWDDKPGNEAPDVRRPEPRELVRESGDPTVPARVEPWLLDMPLSQVPLGDPVFDEWARLSIKMGRRLLASEILADGTIVYSGPPKLKINGKVDPPLSREILFELQRALRWVYETEHQSEIRHGLMCAELSRHSVDGAINAITLAAAIEGAKIAYQLSLSDISKDSLKAIADVRKAVTEEINKTADTARQLATAVAGAVFLGLGVVAARVTSSAPPAILIALSLVLAAYVAAIIYASAHFMGLQERLRSDWKQRFFSFLGTDDYKTLVTDPLAEAKGGFIVVSWIAGVISAAMVVGVIVLMTVDFSSPTSISPPAPASAMPPQAAPNMRSSNP
jgi:hypothetical protein